MVSLKQYAKDFSTNSELTDLQKTEVWEKQYEGQQVSGTATLMNILQEGDMLRVKLGLTVKFGLSVDNHAFVYIDSLVPISRQAEFIKFKVDSEVIVDGTLKDYPLYAGFILVDNIRLSPPSSGLGCSSAIVFFILFLVALAWKM